MENEPGPLDSDDGAPRGSWAGAWFIPTAVGAWKSTRGPQDCSQDTSPCGKRHQDKSVCTHRDGGSGCGSLGLAAWRAQQREPEVFLGMGRADAEARGPVTGWHVDVSAWQSGEGRQPKRVLG